MIENPFEKLAQLRVNLTDSDHFAVFQYEEGLDMLSGHILRQRTLNQIMLPPRSQLKLIAIFWPSCIDTFQTCMISIDSDQLGSFYYEAKGRGIIPDNPNSSTVRRYIKMPEIISRATREKTVVYNLGFTNPSDFTSDFLIRLPFPPNMRKLDEFEQQKVIQQQVFDIASEMMTTRAVTRFDDNGFKEIWLSLGPQQGIDIPIVCRPQKTESYRTEITVEGDILGRSIQWTYPVICAPDHMTSASLISATKNSSGTAAGPKRKPASPPSGTRSQIDMNFGEENQFLFELCCSNEIMDSFSVSDWVSTVDWVIDSRMRGSDRSSPTRPRSAVSDNRNTNEVATKHTISILADASEFPLRMFNLYDVIKSVTVQNTQSTRNGQMVTVAINVKAVKPMNSREVFIVLEDARTRQRWRAPITVNFKRTN